MKVAGVVVEFNPFHNGHGTHLRETREITGCEKIVAVMSGNFVQRGEPAICDKWRRTKMALAAGVDIVVEIPVPYVLCGADYFARASVGLLAATGVVDAISFGSECGDILAIREAGRILAQEPPAYKKALRSGLDAGLSFAAARGAALENCMGATPAGLLTKPNNGLAMEYCKALHLLGCPMEIFTTHRESGGPSATKIRQKFHANEPIGDFMPAQALEILEEARREIVTLDSYSDIFRYLMYTREFDLGEGLENRFRRLCGNFATLSEILSAAKTKRYTLTRLQRAAMCVILGISPPSEPPPYIRVLGFRKNSAALLGEITKKAALPVLTHGAALDTILMNKESTAAKMLAKELEVGDLYRNMTTLPGNYRAERGAGIVIFNNS